MFREKYIKDNQMIQPDDEFLARMKVAVLQEQQAMHIGEYVDYENAEVFSEIENYKSVDKADSRLGKRVKKWVPFALAAACVALVCGVFFGMGKVDLSKPNGLKADIKSMLDADETQDDANAELSFDVLCEMLKTDDTVVYRLDDVANIDDKNISDLQEKATELSDEKKNQLICDILDDMYEVVSVGEQMQSPVYYIVCFDSQQYALFAIDEDELYIIDISEIETFAVK